MSELIAATETLILAARKAAHQLHMPLAAELSRAISSAQQAIEDERERVMKDKQKRDGLRQLGDQMRSLAADMNETVDRSTRRRA